MTAGFRIKRSWERVPQDVVERFSKLPVANVSDCMSRMVAGGNGIRPMHKSGVLAGPAFTVKSRPGDNLMLHKALDMAQPGDIIVCDAGGDLTNSLMGELMLAHAIKRGIAGFILWGAIRDREAFIERNLPVYAAGVTHRGPYKDGPGEIGFAISLDGMVIEPGDLVLGDIDGVVCVPRGEVETVYAATVKKHAAEEKQMATTEAGQLDRSWVDASLERLGCEFVD